MTKKNTCCLNFGSYLLIFDCTTTFEHFLNSAVHTIHDDINFASCIKANTIGHLILKWHPTMHVQQT